MLEITSYIVFGSVHQRSVLIALANSEGSGESVQMRRLARAFTDRIHDVSIYRKAQTQIWAGFSLAGYVGMSVCAYAISSETRELSHFKCINPYRLIQF